MLYCGIKHFRIEGTHKVIVKATLAVKFVLTRLQCPCILLTNLSPFGVWNRLFEWLYQFRHQHHFYSGVIGLNGAGSIISWDVEKLLVFNMKSQIGNPIQDDVAIGMLFVGHNVSITQMIGVTHLIMIPTQSQSLSFIATSTK